MNKVDLLFIVDVTGSMGGFISEAKNKMQGILTNLSEEHSIDLQVGLSFYRDHPSQESSFVTCVFDLQGIDKVKETIDRVGVGGGGDEAEAVLDGVIDGIETLKWRVGSRRIAFLIGDAPVHGMVDNEGCCQCGKTWGDAVSIAVSKNVIINAVVLSTSSIAVDNFKQLSTFTGGILIESSDAMDSILKTLSQEFEHINMDAKILEMLAQNKTQEEVCSMLNIDRDKISRAVSY